MSRLTSFNSRLLLPALLAGTLFGFMATAQTIQPCGPQDKYGTNCTAKQAEILITTGTSDEQIAGLVGRIIQTILGLTGVIFMILIMVAGDRWMTAGGNAEQLKSAQTMLKNALIGMIVVIGAYVISSFVVGLIIGWVTAK